MKAKKIVTIVITVLAVLMVVASGVMKITGSQKVVTTLNNVGVGNYIIVLGIMEILFVALFAYPKTIKIGFVLLSCYFAGAIATELSHGGPLLNAAIPLALVWISAFLRDRTTFLHGPATTAA